MRRLPSLAYRDDSRDALGATADADHCRARAWFKTACAAAVFCLRATPDAVAAIMLRISPLQRAAAPTAPAPRVCERDANLERTRVTVGSTPSSLFCCI